MSAFDPAHWLDRWEAAGGGWIVQDGKPKLFCVEGSKVTDLLNETYVVGRTAAIEAVLLDRHRAKTLSAAE